MSMGLELATYIVHGMHEAVIGFWYKETLGVGVFHFVRNSATDNRHSRAQQHI